MTNDAFSQVGQLGAPEFVGFQCWAGDLIPTVINIEAVSVERAAFLATHAPFHSLLQYDAGGSLAARGGEEVLLRDLLALGEHDQHGFVLVQGHPGTGKSHLIRWLKERYATSHEAHVQDEEVLLIERANSSLRGTLEQIATSKLLSQYPVEAVLTKLAKAVSSLSDNALAETILDKLRLAAEEVPEEEVPAPPNARIRQGLKPFLLDVHVRDWLRMPGGPIDRIAKFVSIGNESGAGGEQPGFSPDDFEFPTDALREIRSGYNAARTLAEGLAVSPGLRVELSNYLNVLTGYALSGVTAMTTQDLKEMFAELRRALRKRGKSLVLFIEDITAFTGIDRGLVDVLTTQHTGEGNREFCRLLSIVGVTDEYFNSRLPTNFKQRVTTRISLNSVDRAGQIAEFLQREGAIADLAARYLNAIRLDPRELEDWATRGAQPAAVPNACSACPVKEPCHDAFGSVSVDWGEDHRSDVGLYPFNASALERLFDRLQNADRTPRSLLSLVLRPILQVHGQKVREGQFPPTVSDLGNAFFPPILRVANQTAAIDRQAGRDAERVRAFILFWGDQSVYATDAPSGERLVGGMPLSAYRAFRLPEIPGLSPDADPLSRPAPGSTGDAKPVSTLPPASNPQPSTSSASPDKYHQDIDGWRSGSKLHYYSDFATWMKTVLEVGIDWEAHGVPSNLVETRLLARRLYIEGQVGAAKGTDLLEFPRSRDFEYVLRALADLYGSGASPWLTPSAIGTDLAVVGSWLNGETDRVASFVREPPPVRAETADPGVTRGIGHGSLLERLVFDCLLIDCISGQLKPSKTSSRDLFLLLVDNARVDSWPESEQARRAIDEIRGDTWQRLLRGIKASVVHTCRQQLLQTLNCPQGDSNAVRFVDAANALDVIRDIAARDWAFRDLPEVPVTAGSAWREANEVQERFRANLASVFDDETAVISGFIEMATQYLGANTAQKTFAVIDSTLAAFRENHEPYAFTLNVDLTYRKFENLVVAMRTIVSQVSTRDKALHLSGGGERIRDMRCHLDYLAAFKTLLLSKELTFQRDLEMASEGGEQDLPTDTLDAYDQLDVALAKIEASL